MLSWTKITPPRISAENQSLIRRDQRLDFIKIIGMLGVIMLHTSHSYMKEYILDIASIMYKSAVISIPLFFIVSGYLLLQRQSITYRYVFKKLLKILRYVSIFIITYWFAHAVLKKTIPNPYQLLTDYSQIIFAKGPFFVFWYFVSFAIVYLFAPCLSHLMQKRKCLYYLLLILLLSIQSAVFAGNMATGIENINACFRLYNWVTYFMIGGALFHLLPNYRKSFGLWMVIILMLINYLMQYLLVPALLTNYCSIFYSSGVVILASIGICMWALTNGEPTHRKLITAVSGCFLLVFTIHPFFIPIGVRIAAHCCDILAPIICWISVCTISIFVSLGLRKIPILNKVLSI